CPWQCGIARDSPGRTPSRSRAGVPVPRQDRAEVQYETGFPGGRRKKLPLLLRRTERSSSRNPIIHKSTANNNQRGDAMSSTNVRSVFLLIAGAWSGYAQISQSALEGTVKDNSGASIPGATVTLRNKGTTAIRTVLSDASGQYSFPNLDP